MKRYAVAGSLFALVLTVLLAGCSGSDEAAKMQQQSATELMVAQLTALRTTNDSLRAELTKAEQDKRTLTARVADLESQINALQAKAAAPPAPSVTDARASYREALSLFKERKYDEASAMLHAILDGGAPAGLDDNCVYWIGECLYGQHKYSAALEQFQKVFNFERSEKKDDAQFMIANSYLAMGDKVHAKEQYERFARRFPASPYIKLVKAHLAKL